MPFARLTAVLVALVLAGAAFADPGEPPGLGLDPPSVTPAPPSVISRPPSVLSAPPSVVPRTPSVVPAVPRIIVKPRNCRTFYRVDEDGFVRRFRRCF